MDEFNSRGVGVHFIGDWSRIPDHLQPLMGQVTKETRDNAGLRLNLAIVYTGRNEITRGVQQLWRAVQDGRLDADDLSVGLLDEVISISSAAYPVDLLVRTSGTTRLSDYMLWQSTEAVLHFVNILWPDYSLWEFQKSIFFYQRQKMLMQTLQMPKSEVLDFNQASEKVKKFLKDADDEYWNMINEYASRFRSE